MRKTYLPAHIANYFLSKAKKDGIKDMTPMKLIKLVYFSYAWYLAIFERKLFTERVEAWRYGPVVPSIYHEFKRFGNSPIQQYSIDFELTKENDEMSYPAISKDDEDTLKVVGAIWETYKDRDGWDLSRITHEDNNTPWSLAYAQGENFPMEDDEIVKRAHVAIEKYIKSAQ
jgi:uncharacterized phage-associated protein